MNRGKLDPTDEEAPVSEKGATGLVARNFLSLGSGEAAARLIAFAATVFVAQQLGATAFGAIQLSAAIVLYFSRIVDGGFELGLGAREVAAGTIDAGDLASSATTMRCLIAVLCIALLVLVGRFLMPELEGSVLAVHAFTLLAVGLGTRWLHLGFERTRLVALARTIGEIVMAAVVLIFVRVPEDILRVPFAQVAGDSLAAVILLIGTARLVRIRPRLDLKLLAPLARRAVPLASSALFGLMIYNADLVFVRVFRDSSAVGFYAAAYTLVSFLSNMAWAYGLSLLPTLTRLAADRTGQRDLYHTVQTQALLIALAVGVGGTLLAPGIIGLVFGGDYTRAVAPLGALVWTIPVLVLHNIAVAALLTEGREPLVLRLTGIAAVLNLVLNFAFVPRWGIEGAAAATVITETVRFLLAARAARSFGFTFPRPGRLLKPVAAALIMAAVLWPLRSSSFLVAFPVGTLAWLGGLTLVRGIRWRWRALPELDV